ncbi:MAG: gamma-glutamyltransferase [Rhodospirillaceae bacterium]
MTDKDASVRTDEFPNSSPQGKAPQWVRQRVAKRGPLATTLALGASVVLLTGCWDPARDLKIGTIGYATGFAGAVAVDEPRAALVARDTLSAGGSAVDAAVAAAWTMAVTLPSAVGVGGGGVCVVHDARSKTTEVLDFLPPPARGGAVASTQGGWVVSGREGWPVAVPALPRGLYALHAKYGRLRWEALMAPAETVARFGEPTSRALARDLAAAGSGLSGDSATRDVFTVGGTRMIGEGDRLQQVDLSSTLGRLRQLGPGALYDGVLGNQFLEAVQRAGGALTREQLRSYIPTWRATVRQSVGYDTLHVPPQGMVGHDMVTVWNGAAAPAAAARAEGGTGMVVVDGEGSAVACALTMNAPFGLGRMAPGMGILLAEPGPGDGMARVPLSSGLIVNHNVNEFRLGVAAAGGDASANAARAGQAAIPGGQPAQKAVAGLQGAAQTTLISCPLGVPARTDTCTVAVDPRGAGFAAIVGAEGER